MLFEKYSSCDTREKFSDMMCCMDLMDQREEV